MTCTLFFEGAGEEEEEEGGGGALLSCGFLFIQNIPKRINYIAKYLGCHLDYGGQKVAYNVV